MFGQHQVWNLYDRTTWGPTSEGTERYIEPRKRTTTQEEDDYDAMKRKENQALNAATTTMLGKGNRSFNAATLKIMARQRITARRWRRNIAKNTSSNNGLNNAKLIQKKIQFDVLKEQAKLPKWKPRRPKRENRLSDGWKGKIGKQTTDIWMRLKTSTVVSIPKDRKKWMHQSHKRRVEEDDKDGVF